MKYLVGFLLFLNLLLPQAEAHPMDLGTMEIQVVWTQLRCSLKLHNLAVASLLGRGPLVLNDTSLQDLARPLFAASLGQGIPQLSGGSCHWKTPTLHLSAEDGQFVELQILADCEESPPGPVKLLLPLPFLQRMSSQFELVTVVKGQGTSVTLLANAKKPMLDWNPERSLGFGGFLRMGMGHIGVLPDEWKNGEGLHFPEGIDHILFVLALILAGGSIWGLTQSITGFTLGHSLTLGLATLKIIHVHSRWIEALIALSIAYIAGLAFLRRPSRHKIIVTALFGAVHGLGFASALQELELSREQVLPALFGFNVGVELGQLVIIGVSLPLLFILKRWAPAIYDPIHRFLCFTLLVVGSYWFILRALN